MKGNDDLFQLIQSMSKSEKRYFKLDAQKSSNQKTSKNIKLFDAINAMEIYDEEKLKKKTFVKHLSKEKMDLYDSILKSMRSYRSEKSAYAQIKERMMDADYLYEIGLHKQSRKMLGKAKKLARELEHHLALLELNNKERIFVRKNRSKKYLNNIKSLIVEKDQWISIILRELNYLDLYDKMLDPFHKNPVFKDPEKLKAFEKELELNLDIELDTLQSLKIKRRFFKSKYILNVLKGNIQEAYKNCLKVVTSWNEAPKIKKEEFHHYIGDLANLIGMCFSYSLYDEIPILLEELKSNNPKTFHQQRLLFYNYSLYTLNYLMNTCQFKTAINMIDEIEQGIKEYDLETNQALVLLSNICILFFLTEKYEMFLQWFKNIHTKYRNNIRTDIYQAFKIMNLVALFELGEVDRLDNEFRTTKRFFDIHSNLKKHNYEWVAFDYLKKISGATPIDQKKLLQELNKHLQKLSDLPKETQSVGFEEICLWVNSKLSNQSTIQYMNMNGHCR